MWKDNSPAAAGYRRAAALINWVQSSKTSSGSLIQLTIGFESEKSIQAYMSLRYLTPILRIVLCVYMLLAFFETPSWYYCQRKYDNKQSNLPDAYNQSDNQSNLDNYRIPKIEHLDKMLSRSVFLPALHSSQFSVQKSADIFTEDPMYGRLSRWQKYGMQNFPTLPSELRHLIFKAATQWSPVAIFRTLMSSSLSFPLSSEHSKMDTLKPIGGAAYSSNDNWLHDNGCIIVEIFCLFYIIFVAAVECRAFATAHTAARWIIILATIALLNLLCCGITRHVGYECDFFSISSSSSDYPITISLQKVPLFFVYLLRNLGCNSFIYSRTLRPIIFCLCVSTFRSIIVTIIRTIPKVRHVFSLIIIGILMFDWLGLLVFAGSPSICEFHSFTQGCISLLLMVTTANPEVLLSGYANNRITVLFFVAFHVIVDVLLFGLLTAAFYDTYRHLANQDAKELTKHNEKCLVFAFELLKDKKSSEIKYYIWRRFVRELKQFNAFRPNDYESLENSMREIFNAADLDESGGFSLHEFIFALSTLQSFKCNEMNQLGNSSMLRNSIKLRRIDLLMDIIVLVSLVFTLFLTYDLIHHDGVFTKGNSVSFDKWLNETQTYNNSTIAYERNNYNGTIFKDCRSYHLYYQFLLILERSNCILTILSFVFLFCVLFKIKYLGITLYWNGANALRNKFDLLISLLMTIFEIRNIFYLLLIDNDIKVLRLVCFFRIFRSLRLIFRIRTLQILLESLTSVVSAFSTVLGLLFILFYAYAIVGMQMFGGLIDRGKLPDILALNSYASSSPDIDVQRLGLLNFNEFSSSLITLFVLMINGWHTSLEELVVKSSPFWCVTYFVTFYVLADMIVLNLFVTLTLEAYGKLLTGDNSMISANSVLMSGIKNGYFLDNRNNF